MKECYAHSVEGVDIRRWQPLQFHLRNVSELAARFASAFNSSDAARLIGLVHDVGKSRSSFQGYIRRANGLDASGFSRGEKVHSGVGSRWLYDNVTDARGKKGFGICLSSCVAGHHAGLPDWKGGNTPDGALDKVLENSERALLEADVEEFISVYENDWKNISVAPPWEGFSGRDVSLWIRMLFSCLVDADYLDTESFINPEASRARGNHPSLGELSVSFFRALDEKQVSSKKSEVNAIRSQVRACCESAAKGGRGVYSVTVPTGGGKTLSTSAFAFRHAIANGMRRIIYVIPFTSIIEQTAEQICSFVGADNVVRHCSGLESEMDSDRARCATENWDAPIIVTTDVQFFESLHSYRPGKCRKLHNIANSVVILDEVQKLPPSLLGPILESMHQLTAHYGCSFVLSTATQPNLLNVCGKETPIANDNVVEVVPGELALYRRLKRTDIQFPSSGDPRMSWAEVAEALVKHDRVLCIVNTRRDALELFRLMPPGTVHLSASMCGAHRSKVIADVKRRLSEGLPVRVVSTQLVEAGVDIDFPVVYRAMAGLESIVQSAGRCNREGRMEGHGTVVVFKPPHQSPKGDLLNGEYVVQDMLREGKGSIDVDRPDVFAKYYERFYYYRHDLGSEVKRLLGDPRRIQFREASEKFRMIADDSVPVVVRWGDGAGLVDELISEDYDFTTLRRLQAFTVSVRRAIADRMVEGGAIVDVDGVLVQKDEGIYFDETGLAMP